MVVCALCAVALIQPETTLAQRADLDHCIYVLWGPFSKTREIGQVADDSAVGARILSGKFERELGEDELSKYSVLTLKGFGIGAFPLTVQYRVNRISRKYSPRQYPPQWDLVFLFEGPVVVERSPFYVFRPDDVNEIVWIAFGRREERILLLPLSEKDGQDLVARERIRLPDCKSAPRGMS